MRHSHWIFRCNSLKVDVYSVILVQVQAQLEEGKQVHYLKVK